MSISIPHLLFASPRVLPPATKVQGRAVILDVAFAAKIGDKISFELTTLPFITGLGSRLAAWVDHHDHERHRDYAGDERFTLATKAEHGACPEMVTPDVVHRAGPIDTIVTHVDLDGLYAAAKWILGGVEPYRGADDDARAVDTRRGLPSPMAVRMDSALRAKFRDDQLKRAVIHYLVTGQKAGVHRDVIDEAAAEFAVRAAGTAALAAKYVVRGRIAVVNTQGAGASFDKTDLLLAGQDQAPVSIVRDSGMITIAAAFGSGWNFVELLALGGGMPTRVTVPEVRLGEAVTRINEAPEPVPTPDVGPAHDD